MNAFKEAEDMGLAAMDTLVAAVSGTEPIAGIVGAGMHLADSLVKYVGAYQLKKIDKFISKINSAGAECAEQFRTLMFPEHRGRESAERIIHNIFMMDIEQKVDFFGYAGINITVPTFQKVFTKSDFFRVGMVLALTLKEDIEYLHGCDLNDSELCFEYSEHVQGLVSAGLMYPFNGEQYKFTTFAKKLDCFALDEDGSKYGLRPEITFENLPAPLYKFRAYLG